MKNINDCLQTEQQIHDNLKPIFECLYKEHIHVLSLAAFRILKDKEKANDCVHELFLDLWENNKIPDLLKKENMGAYLFACIQHKCFRLQKKQTQQNECIKNLNILQDETEIQNQFENANSDALLSAAMKNMPSQPSRALILHIIEGKRRQDVADEMGISINTLKTHLKIAFKIVRSNITKNSKKLSP